MLETFSDSGYDIIAKAFKKSNLNFNNKQGELGFKKDIDTMIMTLEFVLKDED